MSMGATRSLLIAFFATMPASAPNLLGDQAESRHIINESVGVPVFPYDLHDRQYEILGQVKATVRQKTFFHGEVSQKKIYRELWERALKLRADAVIMAEYGDSHVGPFSFGQTSATGIAIRFRDEK